MKAELIFTGSELLLGQILNTHAQYLGERLAALGIEVTLNTTVGDDAACMARVLQEAVRRTELIIITGGLGPTTDDITAETVAAVLGLPLVADQDSLVKIEQLFEKRGQKMARSNLKQAYFPAGSKVLPNKVGTAPGAMIEKDKITIIMLPGPPRELTVMFEESVLPFLAAKADQGAAMKYKIFKLTGISESAVQDLLTDLGGQGNPGIAYIAKPGEIQVRLSARAEGGRQAEELLADLSRRVKPRLDKYIFACDDEDLEEIVGKLLLAKGLSISVAESCTGGLVAARLTDVPGSSAYFKGGVVSYSNEMKNKVLGVSASVLEQFGAVSKETAMAMARGVREKTCADIGLATTGIAGPGGGTPAKPTGLVYVSLSSVAGTIFREYRFPGFRQAVRQGTVNNALLMVKQYLTENC
ncbi:competence/damage-inducible protein A [Pelotomaculum propionicicum]|uniref:Putative competence-damage inducible protein n=1 Tax=Pelotomaculum propionicicum TaxID=258475 RepID=A0A4Y7RV59_9FIRM|nr:competence/damage-inducible protein A [Pelotomaculum propionicicum]NLI12665.1 competence/damage-inducible protein A [Peptococcaceae bacterium]TEB12619.1 Nicotinamide-nucleotide amidohydrolase PncC [Pelotomaculum propionicicum]